VVELIEAVDIVMRAGTVNLDRATLPSRHEVHR
jgi:hypothetical protein